MKKWILNNSLKIISLVLAVMLWYFISMELIAKQNFDSRKFNDIEIGLLAPAQESILGSFQINMNLQKIEVFLRGPKETIKNLNSEDVIAFLDVRKIKREGIYTLPVRFVLPAKVFIVNESPSVTIELSTYQKMSK